MESSPFLEDVLWQGILCFVPFVDVLWQN